MKIAVLMSGGIDSSVTACLLQEQGHEVMGLTMVNWDASVGETAAQAAAQIGINHKIVDLRKIFHDRVVSPFCRSYEIGRTPNPCVECNKYIKFGTLLDIAMELGCDKIATGHYARVEHNAQNDRYLLKKGLDSKKDQSYFLYTLTQHQLARVCFPLGTWTKEEVRIFAERRQLFAAKSKESQEICFIAADYRDFISDRVDYHTGDFRDSEGEILGKHRGIPFYTIGQRKGLGISGGKPLYVLAMDVDRNTVILGGNADLYQQTLIAADHNFIYFDHLDEPMRVQAKIRYAAEPAWATICPVENGRISVTFDEPQRAITPGQAVVYYLNDDVIGGGTVL